MRKLLAAMLCAAAAACGGGGDKKDGPVTVATPVFSPAGGTYGVPQSVAITCATAGATIRFTTDGSTPGASSTVYAAPVAIATTGTTLKAYATLAGQSDSAVASATYVLQAATPTFTPGAGSYTTAQSVTLATATPGAAIHYTTDDSAPTSSSPTYAAPVQVSTGTTTIRAIAIRAGFLDSAASSATYVVNPELPVTATPAFAPPAGTYAAAQNVAISCATAGATIHYTTNGDDPTTASPAYAAPIPVATTTTIKALATAAGHAQSAIASATYTITAPQQVATPTFSPTPGTYTAAQSVAISCATVGATIHYTTSGADPTPASAVYSTPVPISATTTLKAMAVKAGLTPSAVASGLYTISAGTSFDNLCQAVQTKMQNLLATCLHWNPALFGAAGPFGDQATLNCAEFQRHIDRVPALITYDPVQGAACVTDVGALGCAVMDASGGFPLPASCAAALVGQVASGGSCYADEDCTDGYCTADWTSACPGTCQPYPALGGTCSSTIPCATGHDCRYPTPSSFTGTCQVPSGLNGTCPCQAGYWCDTSAGAPGTCKALQTSGACDPANFQCAVGYTCGPIGPSAVCRPIAGAGGDCSVDPFLCGQGYRCVSGSCASWPAVGEVCDIFTSLCIGGYCDTSATPDRCVAFKAPGATCGSDIECASFFCTGGTCDSPFCAMP